jgi:hypothetical protein
MFRVEERSNLNRTVTVVVSVCCRIGVIIRSSFESDNELYIHTYMEKCRVIDRSRV